MFVLIASDSPGIASKARKALALHGHECPITHLVGLEQLAGLLQSAAQAVDILILVLPADERRSLEVLRRIRSLTAAQLVAVGSARSSKHILEALHTGADDYLDEEGDLAEQMRASLDRMELRSETAPSGRLVAVTAASGGSGSSTLAANLSVKLAERAKSCALLELVSGCGDLAALLNLTPRYTIADLLRNQEAIDHGMLEQSFTAHSSNVKLLAAPSPFDDVDLSDGAAIGRIISISRSLFPWSVLDLECRCGRNSDVLKAANSIVVTFRLDFTSLCNTRRMLDAWKQWQIDLDRVLLVGNRNGQCGEVPLEQAQSLLGREIAVRIPDDTLNANLAANCGNPSVIESPKSQFSRAIAQLADRLPGATKADSRDTCDSASKGAGGISHSIVKRVAGILFC